MVEQDGWLCARDSPALGIISQFEWTTTDAMTAVQLSVRGRGRGRAGAGGPAAGRNRRAVLAKPSLSGSLKVTKASFGQ